MYTQMPESTPVRMSTPATAAASAYKRIAYCRRSGRLSRWVMERSWYDAYAARPITKSHVAAATPSGKARLVKMSKRTITASGFGFLLVCTGARGFSWIPFSFFVTAR
jgi:hypothetical protein